MAELIVIFFLSTPAAAIIFFIFSLCRFISAKSRIKLQPGCISVNEYRTRRLLLIISSIVSVVLVCVVVAFIILFALAIKNM